MNRARLKSYAPKARLDFIRAVTDRARKVGLSAGKAEPVTVSGDVAIILGQQFPRVVAEQRRRLDERISRQGFHAVMEEVAYTWFNRFMAIRYMELHGYLDHGFRVLSHPEGKDRPEILEQAEHVDLPGLDKAKVIELKLDGTQDEALYKLLLLAQCHALHAAMPFLFERIDDQTELLLPDNLLASDSVIRKMVAEIAEEDWEEIEVIGWLYQFYISEKKDEVIGKVVKSEDIPAATQLFTPNWIVKYMVQNSLGRHWLATYPHSPLKAKMKYYVETAEQTPEVQAQIDTITPKELNPEELTLIDPACGSGHILCEAYDLYKEIYLERGYRLRDIPRLILEKNLYGLDIDDRAAQMAGFALLMKARADDRRILDTAPCLNVVALQSSAGLNWQEIAEALLTTATEELVPSDDLFPETNQQSTLTAQITSGAYPQAIQDLLKLFVSAKTFGSLITIPTGVCSILPQLHALLDATRNSPDLLKQQAAADFGLLIKHADLLVRQYDVSVMNPPYMGIGNMSMELKQYATRSYPNGKSDLFAMFIERGFLFAKPSGFLAMVTMESWMFLSGFENLRLWIISNKTLQNLVQMPYEGKKPTPMEINFGVACFCLRNIKSNGFLGTFSKLRFTNLSSNGQPKHLSDLIHPPYITVPDAFKQIPGTTLAYWVSQNVLAAFSQGKPLGQIAKPRQGMATGNNPRHLRLWHEIDRSKFCVDAMSVSDALSKVSQRWFPINKSGNFRKWYGNNEWVINFSVANYTVLKDSGNHCPSEELYFLPGATWNKITSSIFSARYSQEGFIFSDAGMKIPTLTRKEAMLYTAFLNSCIVSKLLSCLSETFNYEQGNIARLPFRLPSAELPYLVEEIVDIARSDWDNNETSWDFQKPALLCGTVTIEAAFLELKSHCNKLQTRMKALEEKNNRLFIDAYGLQDDLTPDVPDEHITLARADREQDMRRLTSYSVGYMMGRYSLDEPGLIYAHSGNQGFAPARYPTFPADDDGILPLTDTDWFADQDTANRFAEFLKTAWPPESLSENLKFVADSLSPKAGEASIDTIRRWLCTEFYKFHLQMYKRRPIYWLFSSGKERAFQALVYLHRYNEGTLARMRMDYVVPLQSRMSARIDQLREDIAASVTTADRKKREKEREKLLRQLEELRVFDEKLRHYADMRISLDLDDGVKVNYGKFGDLLAEVKAVTGGSEE